MPYSAKQVSDLQAVRDNPIYDGMDDAAFLAAILTKDAEAPRASITAGELFESIVPAEFQALSAADKTRVDRLLGLGAEIIVGPGNAHQAVQELLATFGGGSATVTALAAVRDVKITRAAAAGLPDPKLGDVARTT